MSGIFDPVCWFQPGKIALMLSIVLVHIPAAAQRDGSYWNAHLAVLDMRTRVVGATAYVREIRLRNFQNPDSLPSAFGFAADLFSDDGKGFDQLAGDGLYTSRRCFAHQPAFPPVSVGQRLAAVDGVIVGMDFKHIDLLGRQQPTVIRCNLKLCACPSPCLCFACEWDEADWCLDWTDCPEAIPINW